ncbi:MAG TPA: hypothetical protein VII38_09690 [Polyangia bacterium]|jgi:hypothetical protein
MRTLAAVLVASSLLAGCATEQLPAFNLTVSALGASSPASRQDDGVAVAIAPITPANWRAHPLVMAHAVWNATNLAGYTHAASADMTTYDVSSRAALESADLALVPLPSFEIRIVNHGARPVRIAPDQAWLSDDRGHRFGFLGSMDELRRRMNAEILSRHPDLLTPNNRITRDAIDETISRLPLLTTDLTIAPGGDWQGLIVFDLATHDPTLMRDFMLHAAHLTLGIDVGAPLAFRFSIERPSHTSRCPAGTPECLGNTTTMPLTEGPCIQRTIRPRTVGTGVQWWMGETAVGNSDIHRTLDADPLTHAVMRRGLILRGTGYALVGLGLIGAALSTPFLARAYGASTAPAGLGFVGLSVVGGALGYLGVHRTDEAIRLYNVQAGSTGLCQPVW